MYVRRRHGYSYVVFSHANAEIITCVNGSKSSITVQALYACTAEYWNPLQFYGVLFGEARQAQGRLKALPLRTKGQAVLIIFTECKCLGSEMCAGHALRGLRVGW